MRLKNRWKQNTEHSHHVEAYSPQSVFDGRTSVASDDSRGTVMNYHQSAHSVRSANGDVISVNTNVTNANVANVNNVNVNSHQHQCPQQYPKHQLPHPLQRPNPTQTTNQSQINTQVQKKNPLSRQPSGSTGMNWQNFWPTNKSGMIRLIRQMWISSLTFKSTQVQNTQVNFINWIFIDAD